MSNQKPVLTISLLISNRPDTIPRCLDSLKPIMEAIPSELILIDTSKREEIRQLLLSYTDQVYPFEWCQDFAKARNEGVKRAKGEWFMFLDDDEWFAEYDELIRFFQSGEYKKYGYANYIIRNFADAKHTAYNDAWVTRLFQMGKETEFVGKVHETFRPVSTKYKDINVVVNHSGYIFETKESVQKHFERNSAILLKVIDENPLELRWQAQMVQEYDSVNDWENMVEFCEKCLKKNPRIETTIQRNYLSTIYAGYAKALMLLGKCDESISVCNKALKDNDIIEMLIALINLYLAGNYAQLENWKAVKKYSTRYLQMYQELSKKEELMREQSDCLLVRDAFREECLKKAYSNLACCELKSGNIAAFIDYYEKLGWDQKNVSIYDKLGEALIEAMIKCDYAPIFSQVITDACKNAGFRDYICGQAQQWEEKDEKAFVKLAGIYALADADFWFIWYCRIITGDATGDKEYIEDALRGFLKSVLNGFHLPDKLHNVISKHEIKMAKLWEEILGDKWDAQMSSYVSNYETDCIDRLRGYLQDGLSADDKRYINFEVSVLEKQISAGPEESLLEYYNVLRDYVNMKFRCKDAENCLAATKIKEFIDLENTDKIQALNKLKEAVDIRPDFADGIGRFLHGYSDLEKQRSASQSKEMLQLRNQVLRQVYILCDNGMKQEALQIVQQLKGLFPGDEEIVALEERLNQ